jgi:hypothetical protein
VESYLVGKSGTGFHEYLQPGFEAQYGLKNGQSLLDKIREENYDYVVLQMITYFIGAELKEETEKSVDILCAAIRQSGAEPVFYEMGWRTGPENEVGRQGIRRAAIENGIDIYAACSSAWTAVREDRPDIELHNLPDTDHPGTLGTYLNLCCFYTAFTGGKKPPRIPAIEQWPLFGGFDKETASTRVAGAALEPYYQRMPEWMQHISIMRAQFTLNPQTIRILRKKAHTVQQEIVKSL